MFRNGMLTAIVMIVFAATSYRGAPADTRVADAAKQNDIESVRSLLKQAADANSSHGDGMTALHWAAWNGNAEMAQLLIYAGATFKSTTRVAGLTPLYVAAQFGHSKVVDVLLKAGADPKASSSVGISPLMMAASSGDAETIKALLEFGVDVNAKDPATGQTALVFAAAFDRPEAIRILARYGAKLNEKTNLITRVYGELTDRNAPQPQGQGQQQRGQGGRGQAQVPATQQRGQAPPAPVAPAPATAPVPPQPGQPQAQQPPPQQQGQVQQVQGMGRGNAPRDPTRAGGSPKGQLTPLMYASRQGNLAAVKALAESGARLDEVSADGSTALLLASINGEFDVAKYLIERGANVTIASVDGTTPLYGAFNIQWARKSLHPQPTTKTEKTHYLDLVKLLLDKGADPNARLKKDLWYNGFGFALENTNAAGTTAFWKCAGVSDIDGMKLLVSRGADPNISNVDNVTPLLAASGAGFHGNDDIVTPMGRMAAVRYLIDQLHADVNAIDGRADAPQETAAPAPPPPAQQATVTPAPAGQPPAAQPQQQPPPPLMINVGRGSGFSALHNAAARGDNEMIIYLVSRGARVDAVARNGNTVADMANGARQRVQPYPETIALLEALGARINYRCVSC